MKSITYSHNHSSILDYILRLTDGLVFKKSSNDNSLGKYNKIVRINNEDIVSNIRSYSNGVKKDDKPNLEREFVKSIIHELKNPIHAISGLSQILQNEKEYNLSASERIEYLNHIDESVNDLNELVRDLLDVSDGDEKTVFSVNLTEEINIKEVIRRVIKLNRDYALRSSITISSEIAEDISTIRLDEKRTKQILANLISNSVKYSPENTAITIKAKNITKNKKTFLEMIVSDQGFGMTKEEIDMAFEKGKTIKNPNSGKVDSFGLGLPIVKQLVALQKGKIDVKSKPNKGTDFILKFPYEM